MNFRGVFFHHWTGFPSRSTCESFLLLLDRGKTGKLLCDCSVCCIKVYLVNIFSSIFPHLLSRPKTNKHIFISKFCYFSCNFHFILLSVKRRGFCLFFFVFYILRASKTYTNCYLNLCGCTASHVASASSTCEASLMFPPSVSQVMWGELQGRTARPRSVERAPANRTTPPRQQWPWLARPTRPTPTQDPKDAQDQEVDFFRHLVVYYAICTLYEL